MDCLDRPAAVVAGSLLVLALKFRARDLLGHCDVDHSGHLSLDQRRPGREGNWPLVRFRCTSRRGLITLIGDSRGEISCDPVRWTG